MSAFPRYCRANQLAMIRSLGPLLRPSRRIGSSIALAPRKYSVAADNDGPLHEPIPESEGLRSFDNKSRGSIVRRVVPLNSRVPSPSRRVLSRPMGRKRLSPSAPSDVPMKISAVLPAAVAISIGEDSETFSYLMLRDSCKCPRCVDQHSKQRNFETSQIPMNIKPKHIQCNADELEIMWENDIEGYGPGHVSKFSRDLLTRKIVPLNFGSTGPKRLRYRWSGSVMEKMQHWISCEDYLNDQLKFTEAMRHLATTGLIFIKDIPESRDMVEKLATRMGPLRNTFYGPTWDVRSVPEAKNVAYTDQDLGFHMDLLYMNEPPGYQLLHCIQNSCTGGESLFSDAFNVAKTMTTSDSHNMARTLAQNSLTYEYVHDDAVYRDRKPVFEYADGQWNTYRNLAHVNYSPPFQGFSAGAHPGSDLERLRGPLEKFSKLLNLKESIFELKLNPGECVIFENRRVLHARRRFDVTSGHRWLAGAYVDEDAVRSRFEVCRNKNPRVWDLYLREIVKSKGLPRSPSNELDKYRDQVQAQEPKSEEQQVSERQPSSVQEMPEFASTSRNT